MKIKKYISNNGGIYPGGREQVVLEEGGLDPGHGEGDGLDVVGGQPVAPATFGCNISKSNSVKLLGASS